MDGKNTSKINSFSFIHWFHSLLLLSMSNLEEELHIEKMCIYSVSIDFLMEKKRKKERKEEKFQEVDRRKQK